MEGNATEKEYFYGISRNRVKIGINAKVDVEVLGRGRKDTKSAPQQVVELLEEYIRLREQFVSKAVSDRAHHGKKGIHFTEKFMPYIDKAVEQAKTFSGDDTELVHNIGCNLWKMIEELKAYGKL